MGDWLMEEYECVDECYQTLIQNSLLTIYSLIMVNDRGFTIGQIDEMQKLHIRTIPMGETVRFVWSCSIYCYLYSVI